jgi:hypothetical protein
VRSIPINLKQAKVQCPADAIYAACHPGNTYMQVIHAMETRNELLMASYAKAYYKGGGWWLISGYAHDGSDLDKTLEAIYEWGSP